MFISHKNNVIQNVHEMEWQCRMVAKSFNDTSEYWTWLATITTQDDDGHDVVTYPSEDFTIVECTDEDVQARLNQLGDYQSSSPATGTVYNIKYYASKRNAEEIKDIDGNSQDPKVYVQSHFVGQDNTRDARILADKWARVRAERDRKIAATDWRVIVASESDEGSDLPTKWKTYRTALRDITDQSDPDNITWPSAP